MSRFFLALAAVVCLTGSSFASVWTDGITYDGNVDAVQDNSVSLALFDNAAGGGAGIVSVGDVIGGIIKWETNIADGNPIGNHTIAVFATQILSNNGLGSTVLGGKDTINFSLGAATTFLNGMLGGIAATLPGGSFSAGTVGVILSFNGGVDPTTQGLAAALANINANYKVDFEFGFVSAADYFEAELRDQSGPDGADAGVERDQVSDGVITISDSDGDGFVDEYDNKIGAGLNLGAGFIAPGAGVIGTESGGFSVIRDFTGPGASNYLPLQTTKLDGSSTGETHIILSDSTVLLQPTTQQAANGYAFADQSLVLLNAVPEPTSVTVFGLFALAGLGIRRRR